MLKPPMPDNEKKRIKELIQFELLDTTAEAEFDEVVAIASFITGCPISLISLVDSDRQWFKAKIGLTADQTARDISFCGHTILSDEMLVVENTLEDVRFASNPLVEKDPSIRFYAGQPLITSNGYRIGTLCTIDRVPKSLTESQKTALRQLARHAVKLMETRIAKRQIEMQGKNTQEILDSTAEGIWGLDLKGNVSFINRRALEVFGYGSSEDVLGLNSHTLFHHSKENGDPYPKTECPIYHALPVGKDVVLENEVFWRADGSHFHGEYRSKPLYSDGILKGATVSFLDVTDQINLKRKLAAEQKKLASIFQSAPAAMALWQGPQFIYDFVNPKYQAIFPDRTLIGRPIIEALPEIVGQPFLEIIKTVFETGIPFEGKEMPAQLRKPYSQDLQTQYFDVSYVRLSDDEGKTYGVYNHAVEVTDRVLAQQKAREKESQFTILANTIPQLAWMARADGYIYWFNQNWYDYTGTTSKEMEGWGWQSVHDPKHLPEVMVRWPESVRLGQPFTMEFPLRNKEGEFRWFLTRAAPVKDEQGIITGWIGSNTDIQDQIDSIKVLKDEKEIRERFVATLTHDLRTPLTAAKMSAQLMARKEMSAQDIKKIANRISSSIDRADIMIKNLLDANLLKAGQPLPLVFESMRLDEAIAASIDDLSHIHGEKFEFTNLAGEVKGYWDQTSIQRVIENLANNAVKYGDINSVVTISLKQNEREIELAVHNRGNPIAEHDLGSLFEAYRRTESATLSGKGGWGIGLALVKGIADGHGGHAAVKSSPAEGTTFSIKLPNDARKSHASTAL